MKKAVLVMNMSKNCRECDLLIDKHICPVCMIDGLCYKASVYEDVENETKPDWCQLKEIPEKMENWTHNEYDDGRVDGWNDCIDKILGE